MSYNADELEAPEWVNKEFLEKVLNNEDGRENAKVISFEVSPASQKGDHFASIMFRIKIKYSTGNKVDNISIILKTIPHLEGRKKDLLSGLEVFEIEQAMYTRVLPQFKALFEQAGVTDHNIARILYHSTKPHKTIVFEDLKEKGFEMLPRPVPNPTEYKMIVKRLAQLHAASFKLASEGNTEITKFSGGLFNIEHIREMEFMKNSISLLKRAIALLPDLEKYSKKLEQLDSMEFFEKCIKETKIPGCYNVLNHGDLHIKNMMFKLNEDKTASDMVFVDFQLCNWGTPALDLSYLLVLCPFESRNGIVEFYFNIFCSLLQKMNYKGKVPTLLDLKSELKRFRCVELFLFSTFLPFMIFDKSTFEGEMEEIIDSMDTLFICYKSAEFQEYLRKMLPVFMEEGHLDS